LADTLPSSLLCYSCFSSPARRCGVTHTAGAHPDPTCAAPASQRLQKAAINYYSRPCVLPLPRAEGKRLSASSQTPDRLLIARPQPICGHRVGAASPWPPLRLPSACSCHQHTSTYLPQKASIRQTKILFSVNLETTTRPTTNTGF